MPSSEAAGAGEDATGTLLSVCWGRGVATAWLPAGIWEGAEQPAVAVRLAATNKPSSFIPLPFSMIFSVVIGMRSLHSLSVYTLHTLACEL